MQTVVSWFKGQVSTKEGGNLPWNGKCEKMGKKVERVGMDDCTLFFVGVVETFCLL